MAGGMTGEKLVRGSSHSSAGSHPTCIAYRKGGGGRGSHTWGQFERVPGAVVVVVGGVGMMSIAQAVQAAVGGVGPTSTVQVNRPQRITARAKHLLLITARVDLSGLVRGLME